MDVERGKTNVGGVDEPGHFHGLGEVSVDVAVDLAATPTRVHMGDGDMVPLPRRQLVLDAARESPARLHLHRRQYQTIPHEVHTVSQTLRRAETEAETFFVDAIIQH